MTTARLPELLEGPPLLLRRWTPGDVDLLAASVERNVEHLRPWMPWIASEPLSRDDRLTLIRQWERDWQDGQDVALGIFLGREVVGGAGLHRRRGPNGLEIGYWVDHDHQGRGIATQAAGMITEAAFGVRDITFVEIHHDKANIASGRVPEKLGYERVSEAASPPKAPGESGVDVAWRVTKEAWRSNRQPA